ncbi:hypothetical protein NQ317_011494, partial [Molorchus minor]
EILQKVIEKSYSECENDKKGVGWPILFNFSFFEKQAFPKNGLEEIYPGIKLIKDRIGLNMSKSEDIYLFRIPKNVDPQSLHDVEMDLSNKCKINIGEKYSIKPTPKVPSQVLVILNKNEVINFKGNFKMEKYIKKKKELSIAVPEKKSVPLPDVLKRRHPLFGSNYESKIKLSDQLEKKLDNAREKLHKKEKRKRKKRNSTSLTQEEENKETIFTLLNNHNLSKRKPRETSDDSAFGSASSIDIKIQKVKSEVITESESNEVETEFLPRNKKRKLKGKDHLPQREYSTAFDKKNILSAPIFNPEVSKIKFEEDMIVSKSKGHKRKNKFVKEENSIEDDIISDILNSVKTEMYPAKKVKKKKSLSNVESDFYINLVPSDLKHRKKWAILINVLMSISEVIEYQ